MKRFSFALLAGGALALSALLAVAQTPNANTAAEQAADAQELKKLEGDWSKVSEERNGAAAPAAALAQKITIKGDQWTFITPRTGGGSTSGTLKIKLDPAQEPKAIDQTAASGTSRLGIYKLEEDTLTVCFGSDIKVRPKEFKTNAGGLLTVLKRTGPPSPTPPRSATPLATQQKGLPPEIKAFSDALRITDPEKKIEAMQKFLVDFPRTAPAATVNRLLLQTLVKTYSGQKEKLLAELDKVIAADPSQDKSSALNNVAWELLGAGVLLDEAERFSTQSIAQMDEQKFIEGAKAAAEARRLPAPSSEELQKRFRASLANFQDTLGEIYLKQGKTAEGEKLLKEALAANPLLAAASAALGNLAQSKGDDALALDYLATAIIAGRPPVGTKEKLEAVYAKLHKDAANSQGLEALLDDRYRKLFPTLHVPPYQPAAARSDRTVLAEVFTGAACPPCVAADLAFDAMLERYARKDLVVIMYHLHIPAPDPLTNPSTEARSKYYGVRGVPSYVLDGEMKSGGGPRDAAQGFYDRVNPTIEARLETPAEARLKLSAALTGSQAKVTAEVSQIKGDAKDVRLHVALVEELLSYSGENGVRLHPMVVRSLAGDNAGGFRVDLAKPEAVEHTFDLTVVGDELKKHLDDFEARAPGGRKFSQKKHAIDHNNLSVVAFVQDQATKKILQAATVKLKAGGVAAK